MRNLYILLFFFLSTTHVNAQNIKANLFGGTYTYLEFNISEPNNYPIRFDAICSKDSLSVDTTNIDNFVKSVFSSCSNVSISDYANYKAYAIIFGKTKRTYNSCLQFFVDFNYKSDNVHKEGSLILRSGEKVSRNGETIQLRPEVTDQLRQNYLFSSGISPSSHTTTNRNPLPPQRDNRGSSANIQRPMADVGGSYRH